MHISHFLYFYNSNVAIFYPLAGNVGVVVGGSQQDFIVAYGVSRIPLMFMLKLRIVINT